MQTRIDGTGTIANAEGFKLYSGNAGNVTTKVIGKLGVRFNIKSLIRAAR